MASYAAVDQGYKTAAVISQNGDDYSTGLAAYFKQAFESLGGTIVADETYQTNESDFNAILTTVKASNAECVFIPCSIATATLILPQAQSVGLEAHILGSDTWENESIVMAAGSAAEGVVFSTFFDENDESTPMAKDFVNGFKAFLNADAQRITLNGGTDGVAAVSALGYDAYMTMVEGLKALDGVEGDLTSVNVRDALVSVNFDGVTGNITFDENGDANKDAAYLKKVEGGKFVFVKKQLDETK
jgi:branched-chain amino acid transport system substrate-binding protein